MQWLSWLVRAKIYFTFCPVIRTERFSVQIDTRYFYEHKSRNSKLTYNRTKIKGTLQEDTNTFHCPRRHKFDIEIFVQPSIFFVLLTVTYDSTINTTNCYFFVATMVREKLHNAKLIRTSPVFFHLQAKCQQHYLEIIKSSKRILFDCQFFF